MKAAPNPAGWSWKQRAFLLCSRICVAGYRLLPLFGRLRSSAGVLWRDGRLLMIERSDRLGLGLPGGLAMPWETDEDVLRREFTEETGLTVARSRFLFRYHDEAHVPSLISVYWVEAEGTPRPSWEGIPVWVAPEQLASRIFACHAHAVARLQAEGLLSSQPVDSQPPATESPREGPLA